MDDKLGLCVKLRLREFGIPPVSDALVIGRKAPIGSEAIRRALNLLNVAQFVHLRCSDEVVEDLVVRASVLKKVPERDLIALVIRRVKPFMEVDEIMRLDIQAELTVEESL